MTEIPEAARSGGTAIRAGGWAGWVATARTAIASFRTERMRHRTLERMRHRTLVELAAFPPIVRRDVGGMDPSMDQ